LIALEISKPRWFNPAGFFVVLGGTAYRRPWKKIWVADTATLPVRFEI
jgi:hypothetical protein